MYNRLVIFGDNFGISELINCVPLNKIKGIVISSIRPQYVAEIEEIAKKNNLPVLVQPKFDSVDYKLFIDEFIKMKFDMLLCNSYSMVIRKDVLESVKFNAVNIHWSLLPFNRGPNPTQWAIIKDEKKTGITMHYINEGLDTGDIIFQIEEEISEQDTWISINERLKEKSEMFIKDGLDCIIKGKNKRSKQNESIATINKRLNPDSPKIIFSEMSNRQIFNLVRAQVFPLKGAFIEKNEERIYFNEYFPIEKVAELRAKYAN